MYSKTYLGILIIVASELLKLLGVDVGSEALTTTFFTIIQIGSALLVLNERFKRGGVNRFGFRR